MTKEEALQKVNDYCNEKSYTNATLTDGFKDKFAEHFARRYPETEADDETALGDMRFALNSAFSGASLIITEKTSAFTTKENDYKRQIDELKQQVKDTPRPVPDVSQELKEKLDRLETFEKEARQNAKYKEVLELAKKNVRSDLHKSFEKYANDFAVSLDETSEEQAKKLTSRFQDIFRDSLGDIKPLSPKQTQKRDEEIFSSMPKIKI